MQPIFCMSAFFAPYRSILLLLFFALLGYGMYVWNPWALAEIPNRAVAVAMLLIFCWIAEAMPMPAVALLPIILFPMLGLATLGETTAPYGNPVIFLFMGGFLLGEAIEKWNLHQRIALNVLRITGTGGNSIVLGFILATGLLSMWLSNTATTMMMFPIVLSVITVLEDTHTKEQGVENVGICLMLSIAYASNYGGIATLVGTPPNVAYAAFIAKTYPEKTIGFFQWMQLCLPLSLLLMGALYLLLTRLLFKNHIYHSEQTKKMIAGKLAALGPWQPAERRAGLVFLATAMLWMSRDLINAGQDYIKLDDTMIAVMGGVVLFALPAGRKASPETRLLEWKDTQKMAWGILLLFGGGLTLAALLEKAGLVQQLGVWLASFAGSNALVLTGIVSVASIFISEVTSNIAQVMVCAPVMSSLADALGINPLLVGMAMTLSASAASMLPMGTPPNAIVFGSGRLKLKYMVITGLLMNLISIVLITLFCYYFIGK